MSESLQVTLAIIGSGALSALVSGVFNLIINRKGRFAEIEKRLDRIDNKQDISEKDSCRTQLLLLMSDYPNDVQEILKLAEYYFKVLHGDWYATTLFNAYLIQNNIAQPQWFNPED